MRNCYPRRIIFLKLCTHLTLAKMILLLVTKKNLTSEQIKAYVPDVMGQFSDIIKVLQILNNHFKIFFFFYSSVRMAYKLHAENIW